MIDELFAAAPSGWACIAADGRWLRVNAALAALNHLPPEELIGRLPSEVLGELGLEIEERIRARGRLPDAPSAAR